MDVRRSGFLGGDGAIENLSRSLAKVSNLKRYEAILAAVWRIWVFLTRFLRKLSRTKPRFLRHLFTIAKMYSSNRRFWTSNDPKFLSRALDSYFELRAEWFSQCNASFQSKLEISGWADPESLTKIRNALVGYRVRRVFRPDVWYLKNRTVGFFTGFSFVADVADYSRLLRELEFSVPGIDMSISQAGTSFSQLGSLVNINSANSRIESINISSGTVSNDWFTAFSIAPREFTWLVEASVDKEVAQKALVFFGQFAHFIFDSQISRSIAIFELIVGAEKHSTGLAGWKLAEVKEPTWIPNSQISNGVSVPSFVSPKYFYQENLMVSNGGILQTENTFVDWDRAQHPSLDFVAGNWDKVIGTSANLDKCFIVESPAGETFECGIILGSRVDSNWFHFLIETLPRLLIVEELVDKSVPVLISTRVPGAGLEALKLITDRQIIQVDAECSTFVKNAFVPGPVIYHPDTQFLWGSGKLDIMNFTLLKALREKILSSVAMGDGPAKVFWPRFGRSRVASNSKQIQKVLSLLGFETQNIGSYKFEEQVQLIRNCVSLITEGGASMSNFLFLPEGSKVLVLMSNQSKSYMMPKLLGAVSQSEVRIEVGHSFGEKFLGPLSARLQASYRVNKRLLIKVIRVYFS